MLFLTNQKHVCWKVCKEYGFWQCCRSTFFTVLSELRFVNGVRFFERTCFASFGWLWEAPKAPNEVLNVYFPAQTFFGRTVLGCFSQCNIKLFFVGQSWWPTFSLSFAHHHKKASYGRAEEVPKPSGKCSAQSGKLTVKVMLNGFFLTVFNLWIAKKNPQVVIKLGKLLEINKMHTIYDNEDYWIKFES